MSGGAEALAAGFGANRKFQTGKTAKKASEALSIQKQYLKSLQDANTTLQDDTVVEEHRGQSLMEEHLAKKARKDDETKGLRRPFDREKDVLSHKRLGMNELQQLVENAKELSGRFNKADVQKSFL